MENLFSEFAPVSREDWLAKVERDLKGKPLTDLHWQLEEGVAIEPFYVDGQIEPLSTAASRKDNNWEFLWCGVWDWKGLCVSGSQVCF